VDRIIAGFCGFTGGSAWSTDMFETATPYRLMPSIT
jgi:hypothetical protein